MPDVDYAALFAATPSPYLVLGTDLVIVEVNQAYLDATRRTREDLIGRHVFDAFPDVARRAMSGWRTKTSGMIAIVTMMVPSRRYSRSSLRNTAPTRRVLKTTCVAPLRLRRVRGRRLQANGGTR